MHQHPSSNDLPHLQPLGLKLEGRPTTVVRCDGAKVSCWLGEEGRGEETGAEGRGVVVVKATYQEENTIVLCECVCLYVCIAVCLYAYW